ncbi:MAG: ATP-grasp domain-containing protein [Clostridiales bacterium]|nr:ATP-grasp domain-containing protein [Clostridiales bacterium]
MRSKIKKIVIVTDAKWRKSLSAIRALGKGENYIIAMGNSVFDMGLWSVYVKERIIMPNIRKRTEYEKKLLQLLKKCYTKSGAKPILLPMEDETIKLIIDNVNILDNCECLLPSSTSFSIANNKRLTMIHADEIGIEIPYTKKFNTVNSLITFLKNATHNEWVVKPEESKGSLGLQYVSRDINLHKIEKDWAQYGKLIVQERIPQEGDSVCVGLIYTEKHEIRSVFVYKRLRSFPVHGGPSTCRISITDSELVSKSCQLMSSLNWTGVAMVEWKKDIRDNSYKLIEINPRFWGGLELAIKCGVNFPQQYVNLLYGNITQLENHAYPIGIISRWILPGDILWFLSQKKKKTTDYTDFFRHILRDSDEWNKDDILGSFASVICQLIQCLNPINWKYLIR